MEKLLGRGSCGEVWQGRNLWTNGRVALKSIDLSSTTDKESLLQEAKIHGSIKHPHIVPLLDLIVEGASLCIVMELLDGGDVGQVIARTRERSEHLQEAEIWRWFLQVASALQYLHGARVLHRDVKPVNIFLKNGRKTAMLGDFGVAKVLPCGEVGAMTRTGTPHYLAPEVWLGQPYGSAADVYSLGCTIFELAELRVPFTAERCAVLASQVCGSRTIAADCMPSYSSLLRHLVKVMLRKRPPSRPSAGEIIEHCRRAASTKEGLAGK